MNKSINIEDQVLRAIAYISHRELDNVVSVKHIVELTGLDIDEIKAEVAFLEEEDVLDTVKVLEDISFALFRRESDRRRVLSTVKASDYVKEAVRDAEREEDILKTIAFLASENQDNVVAFPEIHAHMHVVCTVDEFKESIKALYDDDVLNLVHINDQSELMKSEYAIPTPPLGEFYYALISDSKKQAEQLVEEAEEEVEAEVEEQANVEEELVQALFVNPDTFSKSYKKVVRKNDVIITVTKESTSASLVTRGNVVKRLDFVEEAVKVYDDGVAVWQEAALILAHCKGQINLREMRNSDCRAWLKSKGLRKGDLLVAVDNAKIEAGYLLSLIDLSTEQEERVEEREEEEAEPRAARSRFAQASKIAQRIYAELKCVQWQAVDGYDEITSRDLLSIAQRRAWCIVRAGYTVTMQTVKPSDCLVDAVVSESIKGLATTTFLPTLSKKVTRKIVEQFIFSYPVGKQVSFRELAERMKIGPDNTMLWDEIGYQSNAKKIELQTCKDKASSLCSKKERAFHRKRNNEEVFFGFKVLPELTEKELRIKFIESIIHSFETMDQDIWFTVDKVKKYISCAMYMGEKETMKIFVSLINKGMFQENKEHEYRLADRKLVGEIITARYYYELERAEEMTKELVEKYFN